MLDEQEILLKILNTNSNDGAGLMDLMRLSNKLDKTIQDINGEIF